MRLQGKPLREEYRRVVLLPRPDGSVWSLTIRPLRLGFQQWLRERNVVQPTVPSKMARDSSGRPLRDAEGLVLMQRDEGDAAYGLEMDRYHQRLAALMVWEGLQGDTQIEFETAPPETREGWAEFADRLADEMAQAGFSAGDMVWLCEQIAAMSNLVGEHLRTGQQRFFANAGESSG